MTNFSKQTSININNLYKNIGICFYSTPWFKGIGGKIKQKREDFIVHEILPNGTPIITGKEIGSDVGGIYVHCVMHKWGLDTFSAIKRISHEIGIPETNIGYAGLKDAKAETYQRISIWNVDVERIKGFSCQGLELINPIRQKFSIKLGELSGNLFKIKFNEITHIPTKSEWEDFIEYTQDHGILNYYGRQRFGSTRPILHIVGKMILLKDYQGAIDTYLGVTSQLEPETISCLREKYRKGELGEVRKNFPNSYQIEKTLLKGVEKGQSSKKILLTLPKPFLRLAISSYQSYIFNKIISYIWKEKIPSEEAKLAPLPGYKSKKEEFNTIVWDKMLCILDEDKITLEDFGKTEKFLRSKGAKRTTYFCVRDFTYEINKTKKEAKTVFSLPKGTYATVVAREVSKDYNLF